MECVIRKEAPRDFNAVYELVREAFANTEHGDHDEQDLVDRLRGAAAFIPELSLVAEWRGQVAGHILFTRAFIRQDAREWETLVLGPLAVMPALQRQGIGGSLIRAGHVAAERQGFRSVLLVGHPAYYPRFGYKPAENFGLTTALALPPGVFQACELVTGGLDGVQGQLAFAPEFQLNENRSPAQNK